MVMFFSVSGGAYGIEDAIGSSGAGLGLLLLVVVPVLWTLPVVLMVGELSAALPVEGGYYVWVKKGLGPFWGFQEGWWSWVNSFIDMAIYPVLFADYLATLLVRYVHIHPLEDNQWTYRAVTLAVIGVFSAINIRGVRLVGRASTWLAVAVLAPFAVMTVIGAVALIHDPEPVWRPFIAEGRSLPDAFGLGLFVVMWNYLGWDGPSTVSGEIVDPRRTFPRAMAFAVPLVVAAYVLPVAAGLTAVPASDAWTEGAFPDIAAAAGGAWLGVWVGVAALASAAGMFGALMLSNSRLPFVLAADGYLPTGITRLHSRHGTPWVAIVLSAAIYAAFALIDFADLVELDVVIYAASLFLEFAALIALRISHPRMHRPLRVPGGWVWVWSRWPRWRCSRWRLPARSTSKARGRWRSPVVSLPPARFCTPCCD